MTEDREKWIEKAMANCGILEREIDSLAAKRQGSARQPTQFWAQAKEISGMFKTLKPLIRGDRDRLWEKFSRICDQMRTDQEKDRENRTGSSKETRVLIETKIDEIYTQVQSDGDEESLFKARSLLNEIVKWLKDGNPSLNSGTGFMKDIPGTSDDMLREDRDACWQKWRTVNEFINGRLQEIWDSNYDVLKDEAVAALEAAGTESPYEVLEKVKLIQEKLKVTQLNKTQREGIRTCLNNAWEAATERINEIREEKKRKYEEWAERMEGHIERWIEAIRRNKDEASRIDDEIDRLSDEIRNARDSDFANAMRMLIQQKRLRMNEIAEANKELEEKIRSVRERISERASGR